MHIDISIAMMHLAFMIPPAGQMLLAFFNHSASGGPVPFAGPQPLKRR
jgi:hypothetical protein